jgi:hypothetical protein
MADIHSRVDVVTLRRLAERIRADVADPEIHALNKSAMSSITEIIFRSIGAPAMQPSSEAGARALHC